MASNSMRITNQEDGFTLIELMIVIAIIGILGAIALPKYSSYIGKSKFSELINATAQIKTAVTQCIQETNSVDSCSSNQLDIPDNSSVSSQYLQSISTVAGKISVVATPELNSLTYILTPTFDPDENTTHWTVDGTCLNSGFCRR